MDEWWHGTANGYNNHKCRCERCKTAWRLYLRRWRGGRSLEEWLAIKCQPQSEHGTLTRYRRWKCRCDLCRATAAKERKRWRDKAKERAS